MSDKKTKTIWKHQNWQDVTKATPEKNKGDVRVVDEANTDVSQMYARLLANGQLASTVAHASASTGVNRNMAYAMLEDMAVKCPQYMDLGETHRTTKIIAEKLAKKMALKESEEAKRIKQVNDVTNQMAKEDGYNVEQI